MAKNSFVMYTDYIDQISLLTDEEAGQLLKAVMQYAKSGELPEIDNRMVSLTLSFIIAQIDRDNEKYEAKIEKLKAAGQQGGLAKAKNAKANASQATKDLAFLADNVNVNVDVNVNDNDIKKINKKSAPVRHKYGEYKNVLLSDEELEKLKNQFPGDYEKRIENLSSYMRSKGKTYKDHLATIRNWARRDEAEAKEKQAAVNARRGTFHSLEQNNYDFDALEKRLLEG